MGVGWEIEAWKGRCQKRGQSRKRLERKQTGHGDWQAVAGGEADAQVSG